MTRTRTDRAKVHAYTARFNIARWWNELGAWQQVMVAGVVWAIFWVALIWAARPYLLEAVAS